MNKQPGSAPTYAALASAGRDIVHTAAPSQIKQGRYRKSGWTEGSQRIGSRPMLPCRQSSASNLLSRAATEVAAK